MKILKNSDVRLFLVPTPIGNLSDITLRAIEVLSDVDIIFCEDTRRARILLEKYDIKKPLKSLHSHNISRKVDEILSLLKDGKKIAYISDSGTPGLSDPGAEIIAAAQENGFYAAVLPGANALIPAVIMSGLRCDKFLFLGFIPSSPTKRRRIFKNLVDFPFTMVFYESPHRIVKTLVDGEKIFGDRNCAVVREISKIHEEVISGRFSELIEHFQKNAPRGEFVLLVSGTESSDSPIL
ncbi:16S rRNA (cytidine(1402)-2'-O)-methyltransferase [bacterium]|nr:16S rRNA (cytidine(1402)-2'-O)-methyltransferase [bacterium]